MSDRLQRMISLLAELHGEVAVQPERRAAAIERRLHPLGEIFDASVALLLWQDGRDPLLLRDPATPSGGQSGSCVASSAIARRAGWWRRWLEVFYDLPADRTGRAGLLLPEENRVLAGPPGWEATDASPPPENAGAAHPILGGGTLLEASRPLRLILLREPGAEQFGADDRVLLESLLKHLLLHSRVAARIERLHRETITDELTRIYNYRYMKRSLRKSLHRLRSRGGVLSVLMADVDHLRDYNDEFGHLAASAVLAQVGRVLEGSLAGGWVAKYGGDEFLVVLTHADQDEALARAEGLRRAVERAKVGRPSFGGITCSFGVACAPADGQTYVDLLEAADQALFCAKAEGRNSVVACWQQRGPDPRRLVA